MGFKGSKGRPVRVLALCAGTLALLALLGQGALGDTVNVGEGEIWFNGGIRPHKLPAKELAPLALQAEILPKYAVPGYPTAIPVLQTLRLDFDRNGRIYTKGLATCSLSELDEAGEVTQAERICGKALIGTGKTEGAGYVPEDPFVLAGPFLIFNGQPKGGRPVVILYLRADTPAPTSFVITGTSEGASAPYGTSISFTIPPLLQVHGPVTLSIQSIEFSINKTWIYKGKERSYLLASCPSHGYLQARAELTFNEGTDRSSALAVPCTPSG